VSTLEATLAGALVVLVATGVPFAVSSALRHNDPANRLWCGGLMAAFGAGLAPLLEGSAVGATDVDLAGAACAVVTFGLMWSGLRWFRGATPLPALPLLGAGVVVVVRVVLEESGARLVPGGYVAASLFAVLSIVELHRGPMHRNVNVSMLQLALGTFALGATVTVVADPQDDRRLLTALFLVVTSAVATQLLAAMRAEREGAWWSEDHGSGRVFGVHSREQFLEAAADRLRRLDLRGGQAGLLLARITDLQELNEAFGRRGGDQALATVAETLRRHVPAWSVLGYLGAGTFAVLVPADSGERTAEIADAVERAVYATTATGVDDVPVPVLLGTADTFTSAPDVEALLEAAARSHAS
jgi:diguanylate cyclase (GGDEF)-like protein